MNVQDFVDFKIRSMLEDIYDPGEVVQVTLRIPVVDRHKADVVSEFLHISRNALFAQIIADGVQVAFDRLKNNPVASGMHYNDMTPDQALEALLAGKSIACGMSRTEIEEYVEKLNSKEAA